MYEKRAGKHGQNAGKTVGIVYSREQTKQFELRCAIMNRTLALFAFLFFAGQRSPAYSADPPAVSLDELVKLYDQFELPCPAKDAQLCVCEEGYDRDELSNGGPVEIQRYFGYLSKPYSKRSRGNEIYRGIILDPLRLDAHAKIVPPIPESLSRVNHFRVWELLIAIQSQKLGHKELANWILQKYVQQYRVELDREINASQMREEVIHVAYDYWREQIGNPDRDRIVIIQHLKQLQKLVDKEDKAKIAFLIQSMELSFAPRTSKPGTMESLIDDLVDETTLEVSWEKQRTAYRKIVECGFDIVPLLIDHLGDRRLTRVYHQRDFYTPHLTVGHVCANLLDKLAGKALPRVELTESEKAKKAEREKGPQFGFTMSFGDQNFGRPLKVEAVKSWWKKAKEMGEFSYLRSQLYQVPPERSGEGSESKYPDETILAIIAARYPSELKGIYYEALDAKRDIYTHSIIDAILHVPLDKPRLDRQVKRAILQRGLTHPLPENRYYAESAINKLDPEEYTQRLLKRLERMPMKDDDIDKHFESEITMQCYGSNDPRVWPALERAIRRSPANIQFDLLEKLSGYYGEETNSRRERLRILAGFLNEKTVRTPEEAKKKSRWGTRAIYDDIELRNYCAIVLAPFFNEFIDYDEYRSNDEWACLRKWIGDEVEREMKKGIPATQK